MNLAKHCMLNVNNVSQRETKTKYLENIDTNYLVRRGKIFKKSSGKIDKKIVVR